MVTGKERVAQRLVQHERQPPALANGRMPGLPRRARRRQRPPPHTLPDTMGVLTSYYTYGFPTFVTISIGLYLLFTGEHIRGSQLRLKVTIHPRIW